MRKAGESHRDYVALVSRGMGVNGRQQYSERHFVAVAAVQGVAAIFGPTGFPLYTAQDCKCNIQHVELLEFPVPRMPSMIYCHSLLSTFVTL